MTSTSRPAHRPGKQAKRFFRIGFLFCLPWMIGFACFQVYPLLSALYYGCTKFNIFESPIWVGLQNYAKLFADPKLYTSLYNTGYMAVIGLPIGLFCALTIALLLNMNVKGMSFLRTIYYMPTVVPMVASAMIFVWLLNPTSGLVNMGLRALRLPAPNWISDPRYTKPMLIFMDSWRCGQSMIVFLAALKAVPQSFYEAAEIDGANTLQKFRSITLPSISPTILFLVIMGIIQSFQYFTQGFVLASVTTTEQITSGGPFNSLLFYSTYLYQNAFTFLQMGYACSMAVVLFLIIMVITLVTYKTIDRRVNYDVE